jgi:hypothetical protein
MHVFYIGIIEYNRLGNVRYTSSKRSFVVDRVFRIEGG